MADAETRLLIEQMIAQWHQPAPPRAFASMATHIVYEEARRECADQLSTLLQPVRSVTPQEPTVNVTRFEVIDESGRVCVYRPCRIELSFQDDGQTLKVFVKNKEQDKWAYGSGPNTLAGDEDL